MKSILYFLPIFIIACQPSPSSYDSVDPFIGTDASHIISMWRSEACTYPGAVAPHGLVQISPETSNREDFLQGYYYSQDTIKRFGLAEHFSGWPDGSKGKGILMPFSSEANADLTALKSSFSHGKEVAQPGYYQVYLQDLQIDCRFSALTRSIIGILDYKVQDDKGLLVSGFKDYLSPTEKTLMLQLQANSKYIGETSNTIYLHFEFQTPFVLSEEGKTLMLQFPSTSREVRFKYGGSYVTAENAKLNLIHEIPGWNFNRVKTQSRRLWEKELNIIEIEGGSADDKTMFYTGLYHASLLPINATDINGDYPGSAQNEPLEADETHYIYFTPWDAFRTKHPLLNLINPKKERDFLRSMLRYYNSVGQLPEPQVMTGVHVTSLFADALAKGNDDFDIQLAYRGLMEMMLERPYFRASLNSFNELGYVPYPESYATTATLEFAFNYWALAQVAKYAGDEKTAAWCEKQSLNYRNNYHPQEQFMLTKKADGSWADAPLYAEADKWNMSWLVPHNTQDLINLMGGDEAFCNHLNENFEKGHFILDNECPMNFPFLFSYAGKPWLTMKWKDQILKNYFNTSPGGIPGNDDWGSISSWYLCAALGLFPATPGTDQWIICSPIFDKITINQPSGKKLVINSTNLTDKNIYVQSVELAGKECKQSFISQHELIEAGEVNFSMGAEPNKLWASTGLAPYSLTESTPEFDVTYLSSDKSSVNSNEELMVNARVKNIGSAGSFNLQLFDADNVIHSQWILLEENQEKSIDIPVRLFAEGTHQLKISDQTAMVTVEPKDMVLSRALKYTTPDVEPIIHLDDSIRISFEVMNISGFPKESAPQILVDGRIIKTLPKMKIEPGRNVELQYSLAPINETGMHNVKIGNGPNTKFRVYGSADETLVLHYNFEKTNDQIRDLSGFDNHGNIVGEVDFVDGQSGSGIQMIDGYIDIPPSKSLDIHNNEMTIICRYKPGEEEGMGSIVTQGTHNMIKMSGKWQIKLAIGGWGRGQCHFNSPPNANDISEPAWLNKWIEVVGVRRQGNIQLYVNNDLKYELAPRGEIYSSDYHWRIGDNAERSGERKPEGIIDEVWLFAKALSAEQIRQILDQSKDI
mgnify:CR=1 FL=1|jgi:putative alpha-1,2-mannosidase